MFLDDFDKEFDLIADHIGCNADIVYFSFCDNSSFIHDDPQSVSERKELISEWIKIAKSLENFAKSYDKAPNLVRSSLLIRGSVTGAQVSHTASVVREQCQYLSYMDDWKESRGGRNYMARGIAFSIAGVFDRTKKKITHGTNSIDQTPSTDFTKAVKFAFETFDVDASWEHFSRQVANELKT